MPEPEPTPDPAGSRLARLCEANNRLNLAESTDELARLTVQTGHELLGLGRVGLWFSGGRSDGVCGSYGIDATGQLRDERGRTLDVTPTSPLGRALVDRQHIVVERDALLRDHHGRAVGRGDLAVAPLWDGRTVIGALVCDNLFSGAPIDDEKLQTLAMLASIAGHAHSRHVAHASLAESEQRLEMAIRGTALGVWDWNVATGEVVYSDEWARMLGYDVADLPRTFETWQRLVHPDDLRTTEKLLRDHVYGGRPTYEAETRMKTADGRWKWVLTKGLVVERDEAGRPLRAAGTHRDIDEQKRGALALAESERRARHHAERADVLLNELDHRVRNNLASLLSLLSMYSEGETDARRLADTIAGKLIVMKKVHELIVDRNAMPISLPQLLGDVSKLFDLPRGEILMHGDECRSVHILPHQAGPVAMVLHELLLNSSKHGAIATGGELDIDCQVLESDGSTQGVALCWHEAGRVGRPPAGSSGRGLALVEGLARFDLRGDAAFTQTSDGFAAHLVFNLDLPDVVDAAANI